MVETPADDYIDFSTRSLEAAPDTVIYDVRLSRPEKHNALPTDTITALAESIDSVERDDGDALVVSAAGENFSMGADLADLAPDALEDPATLARGVEDLVLSLRECPLPVVARVHGRAIGAGFLACLGADLVIASEDAIFSVPEADLGIPIVGFAATLLPRTVGEHRAREWLFTGAEIDARTALEAGFATRVATPDTLDETLDDVLGALATTSTDAIASLKSHMAPLRIPDAETARRDEQAAMRTAYEDGDVSERLEEFR
ncbi:enoyl-CoA hydratase/isomerase family protein [Natrinema soli]|uniref:Enoyl-CoA hydratase/isomerase family protein n=1 Tax=Natrinema soli TaxID=1930624 RepID=A0ABD5SNA6_9EURY|nr:enoyl-CoA hydratase/isomerase family protein [Natrinema soli]